jgi:DNA-binding transcriptional LysR family regulator
MYYAERIDILDLHRLRLLRELKHRGTLAAVAESLAYSPSAISQQLAQLETEAGVPLLERVGRRVRLTAPAERLVEHTEALLERLEQAEADLASSETAVAGTVRVAAFQTATHAILPTALHRLADLHPALRVEVTQLDPETSLPALVAREFDLVMGDEYPGHPQRLRPEVEYEDLTHDYMRLAQPSNPHPLDLKDLATMPWVMEPVGTTARQWATTLCRSAGFEPDVQFETTDLLLHARLAEAGHAAALLPDLVWAGAAPSVGLTPLPGRPRRRIYTAVRRGAAGQPTIATLRANLAEAVPAAR